MRPVIGIPHTTPFGYVAVTIAGARLKALYEARSKLHEERARQAESLLKRPPGRGERVVPIRGRVPPEMQAAFDPAAFRRPMIEQAVDDDRRMADHLALVADLLDVDQKYDVSEELLLRLVGPVQRSAIDSVLADIPPPDFADPPGPPGPAGVS